MNGDTLWNYLSDSLSSKGKSVTLINNEIIIGMGAGSISQWMRELKFNL